MKIFRVSDEKVAPIWAFGSKDLDKYEETEAVNLERLNITPPQEVSEETLLTECKQIEACASSGKVYHYNTAWTPSHIAHLKEYAFACGMGSSQFKGVDPQLVIEDTKQVTKEASAARNIKMAAVDDGKLKLDLGDPFHLDERSNTDHMGKAKWQEVKKQANMQEAPVMLSGSIIPIRGGEDYRTNANTLANAKNQNSIADPDAIKKLAEGPEDTGSRLKRLQQEKEEAKKQEHLNWQKDIVEAMEHKDIVPKGKVFPTESMNAQPGLNTPSSKRGVYAKFDPEFIPEKTEGEKIKDQNAEYRKSINPRTEKAKTEWELSQQASRKISDVFADELKKFVK
jgi:hypothetical protein